MSDNAAAEQAMKEAALQYHEHPTPGKLAIRVTKPMTTQRDLSLAYSPGVAEACMEIHRDDSDAYKYTGKGNRVAVISNGTAVLGLGNLGALGSKPVMEGKSVLFKRFADVNSIDIELDTEDPMCVVQAAPNRRSRFNPNSEPRQTLSPVSCSIDGVWHALWRRCG